MVKYMYSADAKHNMHEMSHTYIGGTCIMHVSLLHLDGNKFHRLIKYNLLNIAGYSLT